MAKSGFKRPQPPPDVKLIRIPAELWAAFSDAGKVFNFSAQHTFDLFLAGTLPKLPGDKVDEIRAKVVSQFNRIAQEESTK